MQPISTRLGVIQLTQILLTAALLATAVWFYFDAKYAAQVSKVSANTRTAVLHANNLTFDFPGGNRIFPNHRMIALYGAPEAPVLGALGRQDLDEAIVRVKRLANKYQPHMTETALPTFEIIATVASEFPTGNNDYSRQLPYKTLNKWIQTARENGVYVILDLQPGRTDFLTQAKQLKPLLAQPNVGLALDPEWRLKKHQKPLVQIGAVSIKEVNQTARWLAELTRENNLPQKVFLLHQFRLDMLPDRQLLQTNHPELAFAIQMDGQGTQSQKQETWRAILRDAPARTNFGWKNFLVKDTRTLTPKQTMKITPKPWYVSYQ